MNNRFVTDQINRREARALAAQETLRILADGQYLNNLGETVSIRMQLDAAISGSRLYRPDETVGLLEKTGRLSGCSATSEPRVEVTGETTIEAARRLVEAEGIPQTVLLNFASSKNPGGGFINGSIAQEESLAVASGLYPCIERMNEMYEYNRARKTKLYSDYMIYSPSVPFIKDDSVTLLDKPFTVSVISAPAVNAGVILEREPESICKIGETMTARIRKILAVAASHGNRVVILGAYGCGVFRNRAEDVACYFHDVLYKEDYRLLFDRIVFAVYDRHGAENLSAFRRVFAK